MDILTSHNLIVPKYLIMVKSQGSKNPKARAREGGASAFTAMLSFFSMSRRPSAEKFWGRSPSRRAKRKGVGGRNFCPPAELPDLRTWRLQKIREYRLQYNFFRQFFQSPSSQNFLIQFGYVSN